MTKLIRREVVTQLAEKRFITFSEADSIVSDVLGIVQSSLEQGRCIELRGIGSFVPVIRKEKLVRNISKGEGMIMPSYRTVKFKPSKRINTMLNKDFPKHD